MLDDKGYQPPTYDVLLKRQIERTKQLFGEDIDTSEQSAMGKYIRLNVDDYTDLYEDIEKVYYARFPNTATGTSLDRLCPFAGLSRNAATYARHKVFFQGTSDTIINVGFLVQSDSNIIFHVMEDCKLNEDGTGEIDVECEIAGEIGNVKNISQIVNPAENVESVTWIEQTKIGQERESDTALRNRFNATISGTGSGTADSIIGAVSRVEGVTGVYVIENDTYEPDEQGRPPKSFEVYVIAPQEQDYAVAEAIFSKKPVGIPCIGDVTVEVKDNGGLPHKVKFSRSKEITLYLKATIHINSFFNRDDKEQIKNNLSDYVSTFKNGQDVIISSFYGYIHKFDGIVETSNLELSVDGINYKADNIICGIYEVARLPKDHIILEVTPYE